MNILLSNPDGGAFYYIMRGFQLAFERLGHNVQKWDGSDKQLREFKPNIYIGCSGWFQKIPTWCREQFGTLICYHANPYGTKLDRVNGGPDINERLDVIQMVANEHPSFVFGYFCGSDIHYWSDWKNHLGIDVYGIPTAADIVSFHKVEPEERFKCDLAFVGGYWPYKSITIDKYLIPAKKIFDMKIYGWGGWGNGLSSGSIDDSDICKLFSSAKIGPCINEPHTAIYGIDIPERIFKVPICGLMAISDPSISLDKYFPTGMVPMAETTQEYIDYIRYYLDHDDERIEKANEQRRHIMEHHTYYHRIRTIFAGFNIQEEVSKINAMLDNI